MKIVLDVQSDGELKDNDIIVYKGSKWKVVSKTKFLSDVLNEQDRKNEELKSSIEDLKKSFENSFDLQNCINEVYYKLLAKSIYDNFVLTGACEYDDNFDEAFNDYLKGEDVCFEEKAPEEYKKILCKIKGEAK